jgi:hypothetical protein
MEFSGNRLFMEEISQSEIQLNAHNDKTISCLSKSYLNVFLETDSSYNWLQVAILNSIENCQRGAAKNIIEIEKPISASLHVF